MAALIDPAPRPTRADLRDLRELRAPGLDALLAEESAYWRDVYAWDFEASAQLVRKFVDIQALNGYALLEGGQVAGYAYYVFEEHKGLVGDLYVKQETRMTPMGRAAEMLLLNTVLDDLKGSPTVRRIESQLMTFSGQVGPDPHLRLFPRDFLSARIPLERRLEAREIPARVRILPWQEHYQEGAAHLIATAYKGHVDSQINDQYRTVAGARKFLYNIVQYPGCGTFLQAASLVAFDTAKGALAGICLASMVAQDSGHITQICVAKEWQGLGIGYELLRQTLDLLRMRGVNQVSLTVTSENNQAGRMYERMGFRKIRHFSAYVWEGF